MVSHRLGVRVQWQRKCSRELHVKMTVDLQVPTLSDGRFCRNRDGRGVFSFVNFVDRHIGLDNNFGIVGSSTPPFPSRSPPLLHTFSASTLEDPTNLTSMLHGCWIGFDLPDIIARSFNFHAAVGVYDWPTCRWTSTCSSSLLPLPVPCPPTND
jgi:hypothetical protein